MFLRTLEYKKEHQISWLWQLKVVRFILNRFKVRLHTKK